MKTLAVCCVIGLVASAALATESQTFDTEASAAAAGWAGLQNRNPGMNTDYGWSDSDNAGGVAGEAGGRFSRLEQTTYYADLTLGGTLTFDDHIIGMGKLFWTDYGVWNSYAGSTWLGHMGQTQMPTQDRMNFLGIQFNDPNEPYEFMRVEGYVFDSAGTRIRLGAAINTPSDTECTFAYEYDPAAGDYGRMTVEVWDDGGESLGTQVYDLTEEQRGWTIELDAWGFRYRGTTDEPERYTHIFVDDVEYACAGGVVCNPGDADDDGDVDDDDLSLLLANWGADTDCAHGEFSGEAPVNDDDLSLLLANWTGDAGAVPEPAAIGLIGLGAVALLRRRR